MEPLPTWLAKGEGLDKFGGKQSGGARTRRSFAGASRFCKARCFKVEKREAQQERQKAQQARQKR
jgi:hypothetical protein